MFFFFWLIEMRETIEDGWDGFRNDAWKYVRERMFYKRTSGAENVY